MRESVRVRRRNAVPIDQLLEQQLGGDDTIAVDVWRALSKLSSELRDVTVLFYFDDLKSDDIAAILRIPHATVRSRLARARERLRGTLRDYADEPGSTNTEITHHAI
jgi:RNA polymerase sigma-70 factor (ECF subfamily)